jgi:putative ABC transport system substrate-binding protein
MTSLPCGRFAANAFKGEAMQRRRFIAMLGAAAAWPVAARGQGRDRIRRIGVLSGGVDTDRGLQPNVAAFVQRLQQLGWSDGQNLKIDYRWPAADTDKARKYAEELVASEPDVILAISGLSLSALLHVTRTVPIVFIAVSDPIDAGFVGSLPRPGGNATGFLLFDFGLSTKWLELLKEIAPSVQQAAILIDSAIPAGAGQWRAIESAAPSLRIKVNPFDVREPSGIERDIEAFARLGNGGMIVTGSPWSLAHRERIIALATRYKLPTVGFLRPFTVSGGLVSYATDLVEQARQAASYVDRILKGAKPADLPVQAPTKFELVINLKTAKALGLKVPESFLVRADEVIE